MNRKNIKEQLEADGVKEEFVMRDMITGKKGINLLNKKKISHHEMDLLFAGEDWK